jgi:hypothetical protein
MPTQYLGAQVGHYQLPDDPTRKSWYMSSKKYVKEAIRNVKEWMKQQAMIFKTKASGVPPSGYRPELNVMKLCFYQQQIRVLWWAVELGRLKITGEVSMLAAYTASPCVSEVCVGACAHIIQ